MNQPNQSFHRLLKGTRRRSLPDVLKKETLAQLFSCEFCEISKNTSFYRQPLVAASVAVTELNDLITQGFTKIPHKTRTSSCVCSISSKKFSKRLKGK